MIASPVVTFKAVRMPLLDWVKYNWSSNRSGDGMYGVPLSPDQTTAELPETSPFESSFKAMTEWPS